MFKCFDFDFFQCYINCIFTWFCTFFFIFASIAHTIFRNFHVKNINLFFNAVSFVFHIVFYVLENFLIKLIFIQAIINLTCVVSIIIINCVVYCHTKLNKFGTSSNIKINNFLILCSFVSFNQKILNNKKN